MAEGTSRTEINIEVDPPNQEQQEQQKEIPGNLVGHVRALIKTARAITKSEHHIEVLTTYATKENPPAGLTPRIKPQVPFPPISFQIQWQDKLQDFGLTLVRLLQEFWQERHQQLTTDQKRLEDTIKNRATKEEWETIQGIVEEKQRETQQDLKRKKQKPQRSRSQAPLRKAADLRDKNQ